MSGVWFGDVGIALLTDKDTSISRNTVNKNFVSSPSQVYQLNSDIEDGSYSVIFNKEMHPSNQTLREQRDAVRSMPSRHPAEFPFNHAGDKGHIAVEETTVSITPSEEIDEGEISLRFLNYDDYKPGFRLLTEPLSDDFSVSDETIIPIPNSVSDVKDSNDNSLSPEYSDTTDEGYDIDYYTCSDNVYYYLLSDDSFTSPEREGKNMVLDISTAERFYSDISEFHANKALANGLIFFSAFSGLALYIQGAGSKIFDIIMDIPDSFRLSQTGNYQTSLKNSNGTTLTLYKSLPFARIEFNSSKIKTSNDNELTLDAGFTIDTSTDNNYYYLMTDSNGKDYIFVRSNSVGSFTESGGTISWTNLNPDSEYSAFFGYVPSNVSHSDLATWAFNMGDIQRTMVQK